MTRPTLAQVADALAAEGVAVDREALRRAAGAAVDEPETHDAPWFVRLFVGLGTWVGGVLVTAFLLAMEIYEAPLAAGILGLLMIGSAAFVARRWAATVFRTQLVWVLVIAGQVLILTGVAESTRDEHATSVVGVLLQIACVAVVRDRSLRALCTAALVVALSLMVWTFGMPFGQELVIVLATAAMLAVWIYESRIGASGLSALWAPAAYALPLGLTFPHGVLVAVREAGVGWIDFAFAPWLVSVALALLGAWVVSVAVREQSGRPARAGTAAVVGLLLVTAATREVPGVTTGFVLLILAHLRRRRGLEAIGLLYLAGFLGVFYYQLAATLLAKSLWILGAGGVLLGGVLVLDRVSGSELARARLADRRAWLRARGRGLLRVAVLAGVCLAIPAGLVAHKEHILATGRPVYLDLLPRDPRSLMQGDYMVLRYALEPDVLAQKPARGKGALVVRLDERGVASLARLDAGDQPLAANEQLLRFRYLPDGAPPVRIGAESFFFEEGTADVYAGARYGKLVVDAAGRSVLVGLADESLAPLGATAH
jgi:uncharacterized membrane-anchored protein